MTRFDAVLFDAGGVLVLPDPTVLGPLLAPYGGDPSIDAHRRAHYAAMAAKSHGRLGRDRLVRVQPGLRRQRRLSTRDPGARRRGARSHPVRAPVALGDPRDAGRAGERWPTADVPMGVVSNASGQIEAVLRHAEVLRRRRTGARVGMRVHRRQPRRRCREARPADLRPRAAALRRVRPRTASCTSATRSAMDVGAARVPACTRC